MKKRPSALKKLVQLPIVCMCARFSTRRSNSKNIKSSASLADSVTVTISAPGTVLAHQIRRPLRDALFAFRESGKLMLGICNGFQILIRTGLIVADTSEGLPAATLTNNASAKYEDRWVKMTKTSDKCVFLRGIESMELPVGHGEGRFVAKDAATLSKLDANGQIVLRYTGADGAVGYPANPNGSQSDAAGVCDESGRVFGLMPHPDRHLLATNHPQWTRRAKQPEHGDGFAVFQNAVQFFA